jgi:hypothetical protein
MAKVFVITGMPQGRRAVRGRQAPVESPTSSNQRPTGKHRRPEPQVVDDELLLPGNTWHA